MSDRRPYLNQPLWWIGFILVVLGAIGDLFSFSLAPQSLVAPTGSFTLGEREREGASGPAPRVRPGRAPATPGLSLSSQCPTSSLRTCGSGRS